MDNPLKAEALVCVKESHNSSNDVIVIWDCNLILPNRLPQWPQLWFKILLTIFMILASIDLTHYGIETPYGDIGLGQHWLR